MIRGYLLLIIALILAGNIVAQSAGMPKSIKDAPISKQKIAFYKITNPDKIVKLKPGKRINIYYSDSVRGISLITGRLYSEKDSTLYIYAVYDVYENSISGNTRSGKDFMYPRGFAYPHDSIIGVKFKNISFLMNDDYTTGTAIPVCASILSSLIIGPVISIDYSARTFDSKRYRDILYPSIGLFAAAIIWTEFWHRHWGYYLTVTPQE